MTKLAYVWLLMLLVGCADLDAEPRALVASSGAGASSTVFGAACDSNPNLVGGCGRDEEASSFYFMWDGEDGRPIRELRKTIAALREEGQWQLVEAFQWIGVSVIASPQSSCIAMSYRNAQLTCNDSDIRQAHLWIAVDSIGEADALQWAEIRTSDICNPLLTRTKRWANEDDELTPMVETTTDGRDSFRFVAASMWSPTAMQFSTYQGWVSCTLFADEENHAKAR